MITSQPIFLKQDKYYPCNNHCSLCVDESDKDCIECNPPYYLGNKTECIYTNCLNYHNTYPEGKVCHDCETSCDECVGQANNCTKCVIPFYLFKDIINTCIYQCPFGYYQFIYNDIRICQRIYIYIYIYIACPNFCQECERIDFTKPDNASTENFICLICEKKYYLTTEKKCVTSSECGLNEFPNSENRVCDKCTQACKGCSGKTDYDCTKCNNDYVLSNQANCIISTCINFDEYKDIAGKCKSNIYIYIYMYNPLECDPKCIGCKGPTTEDCISCQPWAFTLSIVNSELKKCVDCEEVRGLLTKEDELTKERRCEEICGDGITVGWSHECDDGNLINGDGCSSLCIVEEDFVCSGGNTQSPHICKNTKSPILTFNLAYSNLLNHKFTFQTDQYVKMINPTADPLTFVNLTFQGQFNKYIFDYELEFVNIGDDKDKYLGNEEEIILFNGITIYLYMNSSVKENDVI